MSLNQLVIQAASKANKANKVSKAPTKATALFKGKSLANVDAPVKSDAEQLQANAINEAVKSAVSSESDNQGKWKACAPLVYALFDNVADFEAKRDTFRAVYIRPNLPVNHFTAIALKELQPRAGKTAESESEKAHRKMIDNNALLARNFESSCIAKLKLHMTTIETVFNKARAEAEKLHNELLGIVATPDEIAKQKAIAESDELAKKQLQFTKAFANALRYLKGLEGLEGATFDFLKVNKLMDEVALMIKPK